jgi:methionine biosynthesis protein MetW
VTAAVGRGRAVLDCGCGSGDLAALLTAQGCDVVGIEADARAAAAARPRCRVVIDGDLEAEETLLRARDAGAGFDCVLCSHVLEHVRNPERTLTRLMSLLKPDATASFVVALPNVAHWQVRMALLRGRFDYADSGVMDRTHLRFFTLASARALLEGAGLQVAETLIPEFNGAGPGRRVLRTVAHRLGTPGLTAGSFVFKCAVAERRH